MTFIARYRTALARPGVARVMAAAFVCRMLAGMVSLSLLLVAKEASGSYANAGSVSGAYAVALAFTSPLWGRVADRRGARTALAWSTCLQSLSFGLFVAMVATSVWPLLLVPAAFLAGAATPPAAAVSNAVYMAVVPDEEDRKTLFALSGLLTEAVFIGGPLLVAAIVATLPALYAVVVTATVSCAGVWWLRAAPAVRLVDRERPRLTGPGLRLDWNRQQVHIQLVVAAAAFAIGGLQVTVTAHASELSTSAGLFVASLACGGVLGSFLYGGLRLPGSGPAQLVVALGLYGGCILALALDPAILLTVALLVVIGFVNGPADAIETVLVGEYASAATRAQAFAVLVAANWVGFAAGSFVTGVVVQHVSTGFGALTAGAAALLAAASMALPAAKAGPRPGRPAGERPVKTPTSGS
ncbi:MFS transporter [Streptomyces gamaensis]|uniref:MFS transporter n=1 Tax=Streptomyces gamaensis TaxID=1763542 RepID=A0ABW0YRL6_9ACTN